MTCPPPLSQQSVHYPPARRPGRLGKSLFGAGNECLDSNRCLDSKKFKVFRCEVYSISVLQKFSQFISIQLLLDKFGRFGEGKFKGIPPSRKAMSWAPS